MCKCTIMCVNLFLCFVFLQRANLCLVKELGDRAAQGRTHGNLGNTYYLLGDFDAAAAAHEKVGGKHVQLQCLLHITCFKLAFFSVFSSTF